MIDNLREAYTLFSAIFSFFFFNSLHEIVETTFYAILLPTFQIIVCHLPPPKFSPNHWGGIKQEREKLLH
jgi:hypothetical protein